MGRRLGLIIGVNTYQDGTFRPLQFAETDARALAQWLVHGRGGQWNPADVQLVLGAEATRELLETLITQLCLQMATSEDLLLIYFAGHAFVDQVSGDGYLACSNTRYQQSGSGLHLLPFISQVMARSPAAQILCIFDCFQSGSVWAMRRGTQFDHRPLFGSILQNVQQMPGRLLYCSCRGNEMTPEVGEKGLGPFMYRIIMGLSGPAVDLASGQITLQRLHAFLCEKLDEQHRPQVFGQEPRPLVLVGNMPSFKGGTLNGGGGRAGGMSAPIGPGGSLAGQAMAMAGSSVAQLSPSGPRQATLETADPTLLQQCQQMLNQAKQLVLMQNLQQAYQLTETILQMNPTFVEGLILKAQILGAIGQFQEALDTVEQVVQIDPDNALGWSMAAALLANTGQYHEAMSAADRSLSLDPTNSETLSIKAMIREKLAEREADTGKRSRLLPPQKRPRDNGRSFALALGLQLFALILGVVGAFLPLLMPAIPPFAAFALESISLALLTVNAWHGTYLYDARRLLIPFIFSLLAAGLLGAFSSGLLSARLAIKPTYTFLVNHITSFNLLTPLVILLLWMAAAALLPLLAGIAGLIAGAIARTRNKKRA